ncbi:hypothetical protein VTK73DRAFT_9000 [Phialemonium thermophilum]|uniref:Uncharacterized protein n=1 Tax=Phialemonium thermophilum TaxID=223376 RepID=A0ABR3W5U2_9PEZI
MPARTNGTTAVNTTTTTGSTSTKRFELPALDFNFSSLTEGTNIPPPLPSPVQEEVLTPPKTPAAEEDKTQRNGAAATATTTTTGLAASSPQSNVTQTTTLSGGTKRRADDNPASPTFSTRQGSIRRLFSKSLLNAAYVEGEESGAAGDGEEKTRPVSRTSSSFVDAKKSKRSSGWFSRLRSSEHSSSSGGGGIGGSSSNNNNKRASLIVTPPEKKPAGPPPPMIPELSELKSSLGVQDSLSLGEDLFKDIK